MKIKLNMFFIIILIITSVITVGFSAWNSQIIISDTQIVVRTDKNVRITSLIPNSENTTNGGLSKAEDYDVDKIYADISLPNSNSTVAYEVTVRNYGNVEVGISQISLPESLKDKIEIKSIDGYTLKDKIRDNENSCTKNNCKLSIERTFIITIGYINESVYDNTKTEFNNVILTFNFERAYNVELVDFENIEYLPIALENTTYEINIDEDAIDVTMSGIKIDNYTLENGVLKIPNVSGDILIRSALKLEVDLDDGTTTQVFKESYGKKSNLNLVPPVKEGYVFMGWEIISGDGIINGYTLTFNNENVSIKAKYGPKKEVEFLTRIGNENEITKDQITKLLTGYSNSYAIISATALNGDTDVSYENNKFSGIGTMCINIDGVDYFAEIVNAKNITQIESKNTLEETVVLLNDMVYPSGFGSIHMLENFVYGNGFTVDFSNYYNEQDILNYEYIIKLSDATIDNVKFIGPELTVAYFFKGDAINANDLKSYQSLILTGGGSKILNSYVSGTRAPVRVKGDTYISNSTIEGGNIANVDIDSGILTLENVITINQVRTNVGGGILIDNEAVDAKVNVNGLTQYNWISRDDANNLGGNMGTLVNAVFNSENFTGQYVNFGIICMKNDTEIVTGYIEPIVGNVLGNNGLLYAESGDELIPAPEYKSTKYDPTQPTFHIQNIDTSRPESQLYAYYNGTKIVIGIDAGLSYNLNLANILEVKGGISPSINEVFVDNVKCENLEYIFNTVGPYTLTYNITDSGVYLKNGVLDESTVRTYNYNIIVNVVVSSSLPATIVHTYSSNNPNMPIAGSDTGQFTVNVPVLEGLKIVDNGVTVLDGNTSALPSDWVASEVEVVNSAELHYKVTLETNMLNHSGKKTTLVIEVRGLKKYGATALNKTINSKETYAFRGTSAILSITNGQLGPEIYYTYNGYNGEAINLGWIQTVYDTSLSAETEACFVEGTFVTLADGSQKPIEEITYSDELLVWDFNTGDYATTTAAFIESSVSRKRDVLNLEFEDGRVVRVIDVHGFFDIETNNFVFIRASNADSFVGHSFVKFNKDGTYTTTKLTSYKITREKVNYYTILTAIQHNLIAEDLLTLTPAPQEIGRWYDWFEIGDGMKYDEVKKQSDIEKYGLYTYEVFADYITYEEFIAFNGPFLKILVGKGIVTFEQILEIIPIYTSSDSEMHEFDLPDGVIKGKNLIISTMPNIEIINEQSKVNAPKNTYLYGWIVDNEAVLLKDFESVIRSIYDKNQYYEIVLIPLYKSDSLMSSIINIFNIMDEDIIKSIIFGGYILFGCFAFIYLYKKYNNITIKRENE